MDNYTVYHCHSDYSLLDSCTKFESYIDKASELGQKAIGISEHGNLYNWIAKKMYCEKQGIKYLHVIEVYLTEKMFFDDIEVDSDTNERVITKKKHRDNYHTILIAKNYAGLLELNELVSTSYDEQHFYFKPRITFDEFMQLSNNVIKISACLASPLNKLSVSHSRYIELVKHYDYLEIQPHVNSDEQKIYNFHLYELSKQYGIPLIAGTDTHSLNKYKAECRSILQLAKHIEYGDEDKFDLTYKTYDELVNMFSEQGSVPQEVYMKAIENTNTMADSVEDFQLDISFKYPKLYGEQDSKVFQQRIKEKFEYKVENDIIPENQTKGFLDSIKEELRVFEKIDMSGFMLFMSELVCWCKENGIPIGFNRGSCGGSRIAYITDITDLNPEQWKTVFSRFCNEDRKEIGDIDIDAAPDDRDKIYEYIINRFGVDKTAYILALGTVSDKGTIDEIVRALSVKWDNENLNDLSEIKNKIKVFKNEFINKAAEIVSDNIDERMIPLEKELKKCLQNNDELKMLFSELEKQKAHNDSISKNNPWLFKKSAEIKKAYDTNPDAAKVQYPEVFYYFDGLLNTTISQSLHPAGIVASPITLDDHYGTFISEGKRILQIDMECVHEVSLVKYDILSLKNIGIIKDAYKMIGKPYPKSHEINWNDEAVWKDIQRSPVGIFQFEGEYAFSMLKQYNPQSIFDMSLITAAIRPSGASYRNQLMQHIPNRNPSPIIDELLKDNNGYLIYQEDVIKFLQEICGFSGSDADNTRRAIGRKDKDRLDKAIPKILEGYCEKSTQQRSVAEQEAKAFLQIIEDASSYMFGYNHSIGYCMIGYLCAYLRYYHPHEFITAYLNNANNEDDVKSGSELAELYNIKIVPPKFGLSKDKYVFDEKSNLIAKGLESIKYMNSGSALELFDISQKDRPEYFMDLLISIKHNSKLNSRQRDILIKIDYFSDYGNAVELLRIVDVFTFFNEGESLKVSKEKLKGDLYNIVAAYSTSQNKNGSESKSFTINDLHSILIDCEKYIRSLNIRDFDFKNKIQNQLELMGYVDITTNDPADRRKLLISDVYTLKSKVTGEPWGYAINTRSLGTGKTARLTVKSNIFNKKPIKRFDVIYARDLNKNQKGYWYLYDYEVLI